jgi:transcriptional regulator with XRE-family HTH domain
MNSILLPSQCKIARSMLGWNQEALSIRSGVSKPTIANFERGDTIPHKRTLKDLKTCFLLEGIDFEENEEKFIFSILKKDK